ncbi:hypothetical protein C8Q80DRAFT_169649 [Daedaleopsis nitida]|nr:hypothetical protein C8Q80DRAFT_169649 [Daedaleopsis nitida]
MMRTSRSCSILSAFLSSQNPNGPKWRASMMHGTPYLLSGRSLRCPAAPPTESAVRRAQLSDHYHMSYVRPPNFEARRGFSRSCSWPRARASSTGGAGSCLPHCPGWAPGLSRRARGLSDWSRQESV